MDQKAEVTKLMCYAPFRWLDWRLTWEPSEWAGIDMMYLPLSKIWKPDIIILNEMKSENREYLNSENNIVRVWANKSPTSKLWLFNVEWSPMFNLEVYHQYSLTYYPMDKQNVIIDIYPWMTLDGWGINRMHLMSENSLDASSDVTFATHINNNEDDRHILEKGSAKIEVFPYFWNGLQFN
mmetsp:Transcript_19232/g.15786  ORF Transcript_19232/g.15786 Transcript_19232/m.15786 type:complete len:181 (+) Transcript_19232:237-779(+)